MLPVEGQERRIKHFFHTNDGRELNKSLRQALKVHKTVLGDEDYSFNGAVRQLSKASGERNETCGELQKHPRCPLTWGGQERHILCIRSSIDENEDT